MRVIPPVTITDAMFTSSTAAEPLAPSAYNAGTTYAIGTFVYVAADHSIYQSLQSSNTGNTPNLSPLYWEFVCHQEPAYAGGTTYAAGDTVSYLHRQYESLQGSNTGNNPLLSPAYWEDVGPTNKWAMLDVLRNTKTVCASPLTTVITPGVRVNSLALLGLRADSVTVTVTSGGPTVYTYTEDLTARAISNWYDYFFATFDYQQSLILDDLPPYTDAIITVALTISSGNVKCGAQIIGNYVDLGTAELGADSDALNFSTVDRDEFGNATMVQRRSVPKVNVTSVADSSEINKIRAVKDLLNASPGVWYALDDSDHPYAEALTILGFYRAFRIRMPYPQNARIELELEEV